MGGRLQSPSWDIPPPPHPQQMRTIGNRRAGAIPPPASSPWPDNPQRTKVLNHLRALVPGGSFFFTVAILERQRALLTRHIDALRVAFARTMQRQPFTIDAIVVLPDHLHCIWTLPPGDTDYSNRWHAMKSILSRAVPADERRSTRRIARGERGVWQRRFREHPIRDEDDFARHADCIHIDPVKHGHATRAADWRHSTFHWREISQARWAQCGQYARRAQIRAIGSEDMDHAVNISRVAEAMAHKHESPIAKLLDVQHILDAAVSRGVDFVGTNHALVLLIPIHPRICPDDILSSPVV